MRAEFIGKDPGSEDGNSPAAYRTNRTDRVTYPLQGWKVTDTEALTDVGAIPEHEGLLEVPLDVLRMVARREGWAER